MTTVTRRSALAAFASIAAANGGKSASSALPPPEKAQPSEMLLALLEAHDVAAFEADAAGDVLEAVYAAAGRKRWCTSTPKHAAWATRFAAAGGPQAQARATAANRALWDVEASIFSFPPAGMADVRTIARHALSHEDLRGGDRWVERW